MRMKQRKGFANQCNADLVCQGGQPRTGYEQKLKRRLSATFADVNMSNLKFPHFFFFFLFLDVVLIFILFIELNFM